MGEFCFHIYSNTHLLAAALNLVDHITSNSSRALALDVYCLLARRGRCGRSYRMMCCFWVSSLSWEFGFYSLFPIPIYVIYYMTYSLITDQASVFIFIYPVQVAQIKSFGIHSKSESRDSNDPAKKNWTFRKFVKKCHKMAQKWPKITPKGPKITPEFTHFFRNFFLLKRRFRKFFRF